MKGAFSEQSFPQSQDHLKHLQLPVVVQVLEADFGCIALSPQRSALGIGLVSCAGHATTSYWEVSMGEAGRKRR